MRPSVITAEREKVLLTSLREGDTLKTACSKAGLNYETVISRMQRNAQFAQRVTRARAQGLPIARNSVLDKVREKALGFGKDAVNAARVYLHFTDDQARKIEVSGKIDTGDRIEGEHVQQILQDPEAASAARALVKRVAVINAGAG